MSDPEARRVPLRVLTTHRNAAILHGLLRHASVPFTSSMNFRRTLVSARRRAFSTVGAMLLFVFVTSHDAIAADACGSLRELALADASVIATQMMAQNTPPFFAPRAFCRVQISIAPTRDSDIKAEVWLPIIGWNGKFLAVGNGDAAGTISYDEMGQALARGYATSSTDTGHVGNTMAFALGHREKYVDFGYRAVHEMTARAKRIVEAFYHASPAHSYWKGCSQGGRQ